MHKNLSLLILNQLDLQDCLTAGNVAQTHEISPPTPLTHTHILQRIAALASEGKEKLPHFPIFTGFQPVVIHI